MRELQTKKKRNTLRDRIFATTHQLLLFKAVSPRFASVLIILTFIQYCALTFNNTNAILNASVLQGAISYLDYFLMYPYILQNPTPTLFNIAIIFSLIIILVNVMLIIFFFCSENFQKDTTKRIVAYYSGFIFEISNKVFYMPILGILLIPFQCVPEINTCWGVDQFILIGVSLIGIGLMTFFVYMLEILFYDFSFKTKDSFSHAPSSDYKFSLVFRFVTILLNVFIFSTYNSFYAFFNGLVGLYLLNNVITKMSYFEDLVSKVYGGCLAIMFWMNFSLMAFDLINLQQLQDNLLLCTMGGTLFFLMLFLNIRSYLLKSFATKDTIEISTDVYLDAKIRLFFKLAKDSLNESTSELLLASIMKIHIDRCLDKKCPCKERNILYDPKKNVYGSNSVVHHKDFTFLKHYILYMIQTGIYRFINSEILHLDYFYFLFDAMRSYPQTYIQIYQFKKKLSEEQTNMQRDFLIYRLMLRMDQFMKKRNDNSISNELRLDEVMEFDHQFTVLKKKILDVCVLYHEIWEIADSEYPDLNILHKNLKKNLKATQVVDQVYLKVLRLNNYSFELRVIMEIYANQIVYDELISTRLNKDIILRLPMEIGDSDNYDFKKGIKGWQMFDDNCCTLEMSNSKEKLGEIIGLSKRATTLFKLEETQLLYRNVNTIMPHGISKYHDEILHSFFDNGRDLGLRTPFHIFGVNGEGHAFSMNLLLKVIPTINNYRIIGLINLLNEDDYIITDEKGEIDAMGKKISKIIGLEPSVLQNTRINLQTLAPQVVKYYQKFYDPTQQEENVNNPAIIPMEQQAPEDDDSVNFKLFIPKKMERFIQDHNEVINDNSLRLNDLLQKFKGNSPKVFNQLGKEEKAQFHNYKLAYTKNLLKILKTIKRATSGSILKIKATYHYVRLFDNNIVLNVFKINSCIEKPATSLSEQRRKKEEAFIRLLDKALAVMRNKEVDNDTSDDDSFGSSNSGSGDEKSEASGPQQQADGAESKNPELFNNIPGNVAQHFRRNKGKRKEKALKSQRSNEDENEPLNQGLGSLELLDNPALKNPKKVSSGGKIDRKKPIEKKKTRRNIDGSKTNLDLGKKDEKGDNANGDQSQAAKKMGGFFGLINFLKSKKKRVEMEQEQEKEKDKQINRQRSGNHSPEEYQRVLTERMREAFKEKLVQARENIRAVRLARQGDRAHQDSSSDEDIHAKNESQEERTAKTIQNQSKKKAQVLNQEILKGLLGDLAKKAKEERDIDVGSVASTATTYFKSITRYLRDSLRSQQTPKVVKATNIVIWMLVVTLIFICAFMHFNTTDEIATAVSLISTMHLPSRYGFDLLYTFDIYRTIDLTSQGILDPDVYDETWFNTSQSIRTNFYNEMLNALFTLEMGTDEDAEAFLYNTSLYNIQIEGSNVQLMLDFEEFLKMVMNSINETTDSGVIINSVFLNEQLYILQANKQQVTDLIENSQETRISQINDHLNSANQSTLNELILVIAFLTVGFSIVFPIIVRAKMRFQEILVLFTKISKRDTNHYLRHYKMMQFTWNANMHNIEKLQEDLNVELQLENEMRINSKLNSISRSKIYKELKNRYGGTIIGGILSLIVFMSLIVSRDVVYWNVISSIRTFSSIYQDLGIYDYEALKLLLSYKDTLSYGAQLGAFNQNNISTTFQYMSDFGQFLDFNMEPDQIQTIQTAEDTNYFLSNYTLGDLCSLNFSSSTDSSQSLIGCGILLKGILSQGLTGYTSFFYSDINNNFASFGVTASSLALPSSNSSLNSNSSLGMSSVTYNSTKAGLFLNNTNLKDYCYSWLYIKPIQENWISLVIRDLQNFNSRYSKRMLALMISTLLIILLWFLIIWRTEFSKLKKKVNYTNSFFILLPPTLLKENQHIRTYLKKKLRVKAL